MIGFFFSLPREGIFRKSEIGPDWNAYLASSSVDDTLWDFKDENCWSVKRGSDKGNLISSRWEYGVGFFKCR